MTSAPVPSSGTHWPIEFTLLTAHTLGRCKHPNQQQNESASLCQLFQRKTISGTFMAYPSVAISVSLRLKFDLSHGW